MKLMNYAVAAGLLAGLLSGCSSMNSALNKINPFSPSVEKPKMAELPPITPTAQLTQRWSFSVGDGKGSEFTPAVVRQVVIAAAADGSLVRLDAGRESWRIRAEQPLTGGVGSDGQYAAVGTMKGDLLVFDASGKMIWKAQVGSEILASPQLHGNLVLVRSGDNRINAFGLADGKRVWTYQRPIPPLFLRSSVGLTISGEVAYAGFPGGKLVALNLSNGAPLWEATVAQPKGTTELDRIADVTSNPAIFGRVICAVAFHGRAACFDLGSGETLWARESSSRRGLALDNQRVYVSDESGAIVALDRDSGASLWKQDKLAGRDLSAPVLVGNFVAVADGKGVVHLLNKESGDFAARIDTDGSPVSAQPQVQDGAVIVQTTNGNVYSMAP